MLASFSIIILDIIWYVSWDKINTLTSTPDFYDDTFEDLLGSFNVKMYCRAVQNLTLIIAIFLTCLILALQTPVTVEPATSWLMQKTNWLKQRINALLQVCEVIFGDSQGRPRVQLTIRWLLEVLLLNAVYISVPWRLGSGIKRIIGFGAGITIAYVTGRDTCMLTTEFGLDHRQTLAILLASLTLLFHCALFLIYPLFDSSVTLLNEHALAIALSLSVQVYSLGKLYG